MIKIACGPGFWTQHLSQFAKKILATDFNQSTLDQARRKNISPNLVSFQQVDAYKLTGVKGQFSAAMGVDWLAHVPKSRMDNFLQGLHNLLKHRSKVIFCDELQGESPLTKGIFDSDGNHIQKRILPNGTSYKVVKNVNTPTFFLCFRSIGVKNKCSIIFCKKCRHLCKTCFWKITQKSEITYFERSPPSKNQKI